MILLGLEPQYYNHGDSVGYGTVIPYHVILLVTLIVFLSYSDDHVLALLELRGDVSRDIRHTVLNTMQRQALSLPEDFRPIFISIPVPAPPPPFCLHPSSCAWTSKISCGAEPVQELPECPTIFLCKTNNNFILCDEIKKTENIGVSGGLCTKCSAESISVTPYPHKYWSAMTEPRDYQGAEGGIVTGRWWRWS